MTGFQREMSVLNEGVTEGPASDGGSSSRYESVAGQPNKEPFNLQELVLPRATVERLSAGRDSYMHWISRLEEVLCSEGRALVRTQAFDQLKEVPHSTAAHSRVMNHVDLTRWDHCIHAAYTVVALGRDRKLGLTPYESKVLELVMLLHDPHRLGSHALDRVFASMPGAPANFNDWWPADDYHEYHGARMTAADSHVRGALGKYFDDVLAILTLDDRRHANQKELDFGTISPRLKEARIKSLHRLKDEIDRCSYLKLDYLRSGFQLDIIVNALADVERHERTITAHGAGIQLNIDELSGPDPYNDVARLRYVYREKLATLPVGCLAERAIFHDGVWDKANFDYDSKFLESQQFYETVRDAVTRGDYAAIFSEGALSLIRAAKTGRGLCVEDVYAPIATMTLADMSEGVGVSALSSTVPHSLSRSICGVPRRDMTLLEARIRETLQCAGLDSKVHLLTSNDFGKTFEYDVSRKGNAPVRETTRHDCHDSLIKIIVAARAIDNDGQPVDLARTKGVVERFLRDSNFLKNPRVLDSYNPRVFCDPVDPTMFSHDIRAKINDFVPAWIQRGGCGIVDV
jgi:hypothetical protein